MDIAAIEAYLDQHNADDADARPFICANRVIVGSQRAR